MKIRLYGDPILETRCDPVPDDELGSEELAKLVDEMFQTMYDNQGVGLAAPQVGLNKRLFVVDCSAGEEPAEKHVVINPEIVETEGHQVGEEGCLSIPGFRENVKRAKRAKVRARNAAGETIEIEGEDLLARALLHENDHLDGVLFLQHLSPLKRQMIKRRIRNKRKKGEWD